MKFTYLTLPLFLLGSTAALAQENEAYITQVGEGNVLSLIQMSASQATLLQEGSGAHIARLEQSDGAFASIVQSGQGNRLLGVGALGFGQDDLAAVSREASQLFVLQTGFGNTAYVDQAAGAYASITQTGVSNTATIIQQR